MAVEFTAPQRTALREGLFAHGCPMTPEAVIRGLARIPVPGPDTDPGTWAERIRLVRSLAASAPRSARAMRILGVIADPGFAAAFSDREGRPSFGRVADRLRGETAEPMDPEELAALRRGFLGRPLNFTDGRLPADEVEALMGRLLLCPADRGALVNPPGRVDFRVSLATAEAPGEEPGPASRRERKVWDAFAELRACSPGHRCLADLLKPGYRTQGEGTIDGRRVDVGLIDDAVRALGRRVQTGSAEAAAATRVLEDLQRLPDPAECVARHTRALLTGAAGRRLSRAELRLAPGAYPVHGRRTPSLPQALERRAGAADPLHEEPAPDVGRGDGPEWFAPVAFIGYLLGLLTGLGVNDFTGTAGPAVLWTLCYVAAAAPLRLLDSVAGYLLAVGGMAMVLLYVEISVLYQPVFFVPLLALGGAGALSIHRKQR